MLVWHISAVLLSAVAPRFLEIFGGPNIDPPYFMILFVGTRKMVSLIFGNKNPLLWVAGAWSRMKSAATLRGAAQIWAVPLAAQRCFSDMGPYVSSLGCLISALLFAPLVSLQDGLQPIRSKAMRDHCAWRARRATAATPTAV